MCVLLQQARSSSFALDQNVLIAPTGEVAWVYQKAHTVQVSPNCRAMDEFHLLTHHTGGYRT